MPLYEYVCQDCQTQAELLVQGSQQPECPTCGSAKLSKQFSVPAAHVSGGAPLPVYSPQMTGGGCGLPQCGSGRCGME